MAEDLNSGRPRTKPASGQSGTRTRDRRIASHSATLTPFLERLRLRVGHCCRTALWDCFVEAISSFIGYREVVGNCVKIHAKHSHSAVCHNTLSSLLHRPFERQRVIKQAKRDASWERAKSALDLLTSRAFERVARSTTPDQKTMRTTLRKSKSASHQLLVRLSKDVFERRTSTGRGLFFIFER